MIAIARPTTFIDTFKVELKSCKKNGLTAILRDETGSVCGKLETEFISEKPELTWKGLNDLPYGIYTLVISQGEDEVSLRMVKRV